MEKIRLGLTDYMISKLGLGCINFGTTTDQKKAFELIDTYLQLGGNLLDTSNNYAIWNGGDGRSSERTIGKWLKGNPDTRKQMVLATKLGALPTNIDLGFDSMQGTSRNVIFEEVEKSLYALQTDYIDLLYLHVDDYNTSQEETMCALAEMVSKGYVKTIGCSNFRSWRVESARKICQEKRYPFFSAIQQRFSYFQPVMDADFGVQVAADKELESYMNYYKDLTMVAHTSLLYGAYFKDEIEDEQYDTAQNRAKLTQLRNCGEDRVGFVLKYISEQYGGSVALCTSNNIEHLISNMKLFR